MIPKIIHYCWFGGNPFPKLAEKCIKSWKKFCPDYKIIRWDEERFVIDAAPLYVRQAYHAKKWAFVTDYVRLYALVNCGGIYMDTDVELIAPLTPFLKHQAFSGFEDYKMVPTGIMACEKEFPLFNKLLKYYDNITFINDEGEMNLTTNVTIITNACLEKGLVQNNSFQVIEGFALYPKEYFCPKSYTDGVIYLTSKTCCIHHFNASWLTEQEKKVRGEKWAKNQAKMQKEAYKQKKKKVKLIIKRLIVFLFGYTIFKIVRRFYYRIVG